MISHLPCPDQTETLCDVGSNSNNPFRPSKKRRVATKAQVRFSDDVVVHEDDKGNNNNNNPKELQSTPVSTWLSPNDFTKIKNGVFTTLEFVKLQGDSFGFDTPLASRYCSRGLEDYDTEQKCTKFSTVRRRTEAIQVVLKEQEFQRQQLLHQLQGGMPYCLRGFKDYHMGQKGFTASINLQRHQFNLQRQQYMQRLQGGVQYNGMLDHSKISEVYINHTFYNAEDAIDMGRKDSEDALTIYRTHPLPLGVDIAPANTAE